VSATHERDETQQAQMDAIRRLRGAPPAPTAADTAANGSYAGLVTRVIAFAIDAAIINGVAALVGVTVGLALSILHLPEQADAAIGALLGALLILWSISYFVFFWSSTGQTPGSRAMCITVVDGRRRGPLKPRRALLRFGGLCLAALPLGAGLWIMLWDDRSRCLQDRLARTVVVYTPNVA
jgi:uncharacterized RDD family membrane protein YckC